MSTLDHNEPEGEKFLGSHGPKPEEIDASAGYERSDASVTGIAVFMISLLIFVAVVGMLCYGIGAWFNARMNREDGPNSKWTKTVDVRQLGNLPSSPELQNKIAEITQSFPTPRLLTDDGDQDVADLHAREDLLLSNKLGSIQFDSAHDRAVGSINGGRVLTSSVKCGGDGFAGLFLAAGGERFQVKNAHRALRAHPW